MKRKNAFLAHGKIPMMRTLICMLQLSWISVQVQLVTAFTMLPTYSILQNSIRNQNYHPYHCCHYRRPTDSAPDAAVMPSLQAGASSVDIICSPPDDKNDYNFIVGNTAVLSADSLDFSRSLLVEGSAYATSLVCSTGTSSNSVVGTRVKLSPGGLLCADIRGVDKVEIFGKVVGDIQCKHLIVGKGGEVRGDVQVSDLTVGGGTITGSVQCDTHIPVSVFLRNNQNYVLNSHNRLNSVAALMDAARRVEPKADHRHDAAYHSYHKRTKDLNDAAALKKQKRTSSSSVTTADDPPEQPRPAPPSYLNDAACLINKAPAPTYTVPTYLNDVAALGLTMDSQYKRRVHGPRRIPVDLNKYNDVKNPISTATTHADPEVPPKPKPTLTRTPKPVTSPPSYLNDAAVLLMNQQEASSKTDRTQTQVQDCGITPLYSHTTATSTKLRKDFYKAAHGIDLSSYEKGHKGPPVDLSALNDVTGGRVSTPKTNNNSSNNDMRNGQVVAPAISTLHAPSIAPPVPSIPSNREKNTITTPVVVDSKLPIPQEDIGAHNMKQKENISDPFAELDNLISEEGVQSDVSATRLDESTNKQAIHQDVSSQNTPTGPPIAAAAAHVVDALNNLATQADTLEDQPLKVPQATISPLTNTKPATMAASTLKSDDVNALNDVAAMKSDNFNNTSDTDLSAEEQCHNASKHGVKLDRDKLYSEATHEELVDEFGTKLFVAPTAETVQSLNINRELVLETQRLLGKNKSSSSDRPLRDWSKELGDSDGYDRPPGVPVAGTNGTSGRDVHAFNESFTTVATNDTTRHEATHVRRTRSLPEDPGESPYNGAKHGRKLCRDKMYSAANQEELVDEFGTKLFVAPSASTVQSLNKNRNLVLATQRLLQEKKEREAAAPARRDIFNMDKHGMSDTNLSDKNGQDRGNEDDVKGRFGKILRFFFE